MAERVGFEPTVRLHAQRFSRPSRSTTLAPLRGTRGYSIRNLKRKRTREIAWNQASAGPERAAPSRHAGLWRRLPGVRATAGCGVGLALVDCDGLAISRPLCAIARAARHRLGLGEGEACVRCVQDPTGRGAEAARCRRVSWDNHFRIGASTKVESTHETITTTPRKTTPTIGPRLVSAPGFASS